MSNLGDGQRPDSREGKTQVLLATETNHPSSPHITRAIIR